MKKYKILVPFIFLIILVLELSANLCADNTMQLLDVSGEPFDTVTVNIEIINDDPFVAFQLDVPLFDQIVYVSNSTSLVLDRSVDHTINATIINDDTLRIFAYSPSNTAFTGNSGNVATFEIILGPIPGNYSLELESPIIGNSSSLNILTGAIDGVLSINAPDIHLNTDSLYYDRTPLGGQTDRSFTIYNNGTTELSILDLNPDNEYFSIIGDTAFIIQASGQHAVTVRFHSIVKGTYNNTVTILSDDPDEQSVEVKLTAIAFAVNELHVGNMFSFSGDTTKLYCSINNMESFVGFQFDLILPSPMEYITGTVQLSDRADDHIVSANQMNDTLRVVAYSPTNTAFSDTSGNIVSMDFYVEGTGGYYSLNLHDPIIGDVLGDNVISDHYNGQLEIAAADISGPCSLNFNEISLLNTTQSSVTLYNYGSDTLEINQISFTDTSFWTDISIPQNINISSQLSVPVYYHNSLEGSYNGVMKIYSNDPDESPFNITLSGSSFSPNYLIVRDTTACAGDTITVAVDVENYDEFVAFQFDLNFSEQLQFVSNSAQLSTRAQDHLLIQSLLDSTNLRIISYSMNQNPFLGNDGTILTLEFVVDENCPNQDIPLTLSDAILGDGGSNDILHSVQNGVIEIIPSPPTSPDNVNIEIIGNGAIITWNPVITNVNGNPINVDGYVIYSSNSPDSAFNYLASTTDTTYTYSNIALSSKMFYQVTSYVGDIPVLLEIFADHPDTKLGELDGLVESKKNFFRIRK